MMPPISNFGNDTFIQSEPFAAFDRLSDSTFGKNTNKMRAILSVAVNVRGEARSRNPSRRQRVRNELPRQGLLHRDRPEYAWCCPRDRDADARRRFRDKHADQRIARCRNSVPSRNRLRTELERLLP